MLLCEWMATIRYFLHSLRLSCIIHLEHNNTRILCWLKYCTCLKLTEIDFHPEKYGILFNYLKLKMKETNKLTSWSRGGESRFLLLWMSVCLYTSSDQKTSNIFLKNSIYSIIGITITEQVISDFISVFNYSCHI